MSDEDVVAYKNTNTNEIHLTHGPHPELEARPNMVRVSLSEVPPSVLEGARKAAVERDAIEQAARNRAQGGFTDTPSDNPVTPTATHMQPPGSNDGTGILSRPGMRNEHPGPAWTNPVGQEVLGGRDRDQRTYPDQRGVLARGQDPNAPTVHEGLLPKPVIVGAPGEPAVDEDGVVVADEPAGAGSDPDEEEAATGPIVDATVVEAEDAETNVVDASADEPGGDEPPVPAKAARKPKG